MCPLLFGLALLAALDDAPKDAPIATIAQLWSGFDPRAVPLDVEVVRAWDEGDVHLETVYFTGEVFEGEVVRVFGHFGRPREPGGKVPGRPARPRRRADGRARLAPLQGEARVRLPELRLLRGHQPARPRPRLPTRALHPVGPGAGRHDEGRRR